MSDEHLRELERRWKETGSVEDEDAYLRERVRIGDLTQDKLELAAYLGHQAARRYLGEQAPQAPEKLENFVGHLKSWGKETLVRSIVAAALTCLHLWEKQLPEDHRPQLAINAAIAWILCPCENHEKAARTAAEAAKAAAEASGLPNDMGDGKAAWTGARGAAWAAEAVDGTVANAAWAAARGAVWIDNWTPPACQVKQAITDALTPWALGYSDPVRESVEARAADPPRT